MSGILREPPSPALVTTTLQREVYHKKFMGGKAVISMGQGNTGVKARNLLPRICASREWSHWPMALGQSAAVVGLSGNPDV